ncbi:MAG: hypothetical protein ACK4TN_03840 [Brevinematales bacterium]
MRDLFFSLTMLFSFVLLFGQGSGNEVQIKTIQENPLSTNGFLLPDNELTNHPQVQQDTFGDSRDAISSSSASQRYTYHHMLGVHYGVASGAGLCYKYYFSAPFALQFSFVPFYTSGENGSGVGFVIGGVFWQWFLHDFSHPLQSLEGRFFVWSGMKGGRYFGMSAFYEYYAESINDYEFSGGGGIGFETYAIKNIVLTVAVGYFVQFTSQITFVNFSSPLSFEGTLGYRF